QLNFRLAELAKDQKHGVQVAKSLALTHTLARLGRADLETTLKAMSTAGFGPDLIAEVAAERNVAPLFQRLPIPTSPYKYPVTGGLPTAYLGAESTGNPPGTSNRNAVTFSDAGTLAPTFTAKKLQVGIATSDEWNEDA